VLLQIYQKKIFCLEYVLIKLFQNQNTFVHGTGKVMDKACIVMDESS